MSENEKNLNEEPETQSAETEPSAEPVAASAPVELTVVDGSESSVESDGQASVKRARFAPFPQSPSPTEQNSIDLLLDVRLDLSVELGRASIPVRDVLQLGAGSIVTLEKLSGEPVDIMVNGKLIARGEVVVVDENFGVRVTEMVDRTDAAAQVG